MKTKIPKIIKSLSHGWLIAERETSILKFDEKADTLKMSVPIAYCRKPELILMAKHRKTG